MNISEGTSGLNPTILSIDIDKYKNKIIDFLNELKTRILNKDSDNSQYASSVIDTQTLNEEVNEEYIKYLYTTMIHPILESVNKIAFELKEEPIFHKEFFDFLEIQQITECVLKPQDYAKLNIDKVNFLIALFKEFNNLISIKSDLLKNTTPENPVKDETLYKYEEEYASFDKVFSKQKEHFYLEMYTPSGKHKKTIDKLYTIMKE